MSLSAALVLYDNYLSAISLFRADLKLRQHLNRADSGFAIRTGDDQSRQRRGAGNEAWPAERGPALPRGDEIASGRGEAMEGLVQVQVIRLARR